MRFLEAERGEQSGEEDLGLSWSPGHVRFAPPTEFFPPLKVALSHFTPAGRPRFLMTEAVTPEVF